MSSSRVAELEMRYSALPESRDEMVAPAPRAKKSPPRGAAPESHMESFIESMAEREAMVEQSKSASLMNQAPNKHLACKKLTATDPTLFCRPRLKIVY